MIDTSAKNFNYNLNLNIKIIRIRYQYQYQYCRTHNSISISIPIPKTIKFKLNPKTIPRYLDILRSQDNTQKIRASIAQLWLRTERLQIFSRQLSSRRAEKCIISSTTSVFGIRKYQQTKKKDAMQEADCKNNNVTHKCFFLLFEDVKKKVFIKSVFEAWTGHSQSEAWPYHDVFLHENLQ